MHCKPSNTEEADDIIQVDRVKHFLIYKFRDMFTLRICFQKLAIGYVNLRFNTCDFSLVSFVFKNHTVIFLGAECLQLVNHIFIFL
jgi:hypothetical protein